MSPQNIPQTMKNKGFGHLKTSIFTITASKHVGFGVPWYINTQKSPSEPKLW